MYINKSAINDILECLKVQRGKIISARRQNTYQIKRLAELQKKYKAEEAELSRLISKLPHRQKVKA